MIAWIASFLWGMHCLETAAQWLSKGLDQVESSWMVSRVVHGGGGKHRGVCADAVEQIIHMVTWALINLNRHSMGACSAHDLHLRDGRGAGQASALCKS